MSVPILKGPWSGYLPDDDGGNNTEDPHWGCMQHICELCWSLVALNKLSPDTLTKLTTRLESLGALRNLTVKDSHQLLLCEEQCPDALPYAVRRKASQLFKGQDALPTISRCGGRNAGIVLHVATILCMCQCAVG